MYHTELAGGTEQPSDPTEWNSLFEDVLDPSTGLPLMSHSSMNLPSASSSVGGPGMGGMSKMDSWVLEETKKLEAQQRIQQQKLLDLKQVCVCVYPLY